MGPPPICVHSGSRTLGLRVARSSDGGGTMACRAMSSSSGGGLWQNRPKQHASRGARLPPDTKHPENRLHRTVSSSTPQGRTQIIHVFLQDPTMRMRLQYLVHFIQPEFLEIHYYSTKSRVWNLNSENYNKHLTIEYKDPYVPTRRILHTIATLQAAPAIG